MPDKSVKYSGMSIFPLLFSFAQDQHLLMSFVSLGHRDDDTQSMPDVRSEYTNTVIVLQRILQETSLCFHRAN